MPAKLSDEERKARKRERNRKYRENMTPEQRERERTRMRMENMTPEQIERRRAGDRFENLTPEQQESRRKRGRRENMTPEQQEKNRARGLVENMTPEQRGRRRQYNLLRRYGITLEDKISLLEFQNYTCACCSKPLIPAPFEQKGVRAHDPVTEHDHDTGEIRGVTCQRCNWIIGYMGDTLEAAQEWECGRVIRYMESAPARVAVWRAWRTETKTP